MDAITLKHVEKAYTSYSTEVVLTGQERESRTRQVLRDLSLQFPVGQLTVIVGRSGCGKSTLLKLLAGQEQPDGGEICIPEGWHSAMLRPDPYVITWTNVQRNVAMACGVGKTPEERYEKASEFVRLVGLEDYADLTPVELSTGMKQRLGLARVLAGQAELLLMDEPFASLDFLTRGELQEQLLAIQQRMPRTIVLVTHQLEEALVLGQKIIVMHPDSTAQEFDLSGEPYPRNMEAPYMRQLKREITQECGRPTAGPGDERQEPSPLIADAIEKMTAFYQGGIHDIDHFLKVWAFARTIGQQEGLDGHTQQVLELAAVVHDISCPMCREKYGNTNGKKQELESPALVEPFLRDLAVAEADIRRVSWLVAHHHTYTDVDGLDHRILLEADYLVNAGESSYGRENVEAALQNIFRTESGKRLLRDVFLGR